MMAKVSERRQKNEYQKTRCAPLSPVLVGDSNRHLAMWRIFRGVCSLMDGSFRTIRIEDNFGHYMIWEVFKVERPFSTIRVYIAVHDIKIKVSVSVKDDCIAQVSWCSQFFDQHHLFDRYHFTCRATTHSLLGQLSYCIIPQPSC